MGRQAAPQGAPQVTAWLFTFCAFSLFFLPLGREFSQTQKAVDLAFAIFCAIGGMAVMMVVAIAIRLSYHTYMMIGS